MNDITKVDGAFEYRGLPYPTEIEARLVRIDVEGSVAFRVAVEELINTYYWLESRPVAAAELAISGAVFDVSLCKDYTHLAEVGGQYWLELLRGPYITCTCQYYRFTAKAFECRDGLLRKFCKHTLAYIYLHWGEYGSWFFEDVADLHFKTG